MLAKWLRWSRVAGPKVREHDKRSSTPAPLRDVKRVWMESLSQGMARDEGVKDQD